MDADHVGADESNVFGLGSSPFFPFASRPFGRGAQAAASSAWPVVPAEPGSGGESVPAEIQWAGMDVAEMG